MRHISKQGLCVLNASNYRKVASSNKSRLEAHAGFFRLLIMAIPVVEFSNQGHIKYHKVESSNTSCLAAHADFFRLLMKVN